MLGIEARHSSTTHSFAPHILGRLEDHLNPSDRIGTVVVVNVMAEERFTCLVKSQISHN